MSDQRRREDADPRGDLRASRNVSRWILIALAVWSVIGWLIISLVPAEAQDLPPWAHRDDTEITVRFDHQSGNARVDNLPRHDIGRAMGGRAMGGRKLTPSDS